MACMPRAPHARSSFGREAPKLVSNKLLKSLSQLTLSVQVTNHRACTDTHYSCHSPETPHKGPSNTPHSHPPVGLARHLQGDPPGKHLYRTYIAQQQSFHAALLHVAPIRTTRPTPRPTARPTTTRPAARPTTRRSAHRTPHATSFNIPYTILHDSFNAAAGVQPRKSYARRLANATARPAAAKDQGPRRKHKLSARWLALNSYRYCHPQRTILTSK